MKCGRSNAEQSWFSIGNWIVGGVRELLNRLSCPFFSILDPILADPISLSIPEKCRYYCIRTREYRTIHSHLVRNRQERENIHGNCWIIKQLVETAQCLLPDLTAMVCFFSSFFSSSTSPLHHCLIMFLFSCSFLLCSSILLPSIHSFLQSISNTDDLSSSPESSLFLIFYFTLYLYFIILIVVY